MHILSRVQTVVSDLEPHTIALLCVILIGPVVFLQLVSSFFGFSATYMFLEYLGLRWFWSSDESRSERKSGRKGKGIRRRADLSDVNSSLGTFGVIVVGLS